MTCPHHASPRPMLFESLEPRLLLDGAHFVVDSLADITLSDVVMDVPRFKLTLSNPEAWSKGDPDRPHPDLLGDFDGNGAFNGLDIPGFKTALSGAVAAASAPLDGSRSMGVDAEAVGVSSVKLASLGPVRVLGRDLLVNGQPYTVKSVGYAPVPIGSNPEWGYDVTVHPELRARDFPLLRRMGVNTIRTWGKVGQEGFLDDAYNGGERPIRVIMGYWMGAYRDYRDPAVRQAVKDDFRAYVAAYKDHPAVLVWAIGNEENHFYAQGDNARHAAYFSLVDEMAREAWLEEGEDYHPVMAIALEMPGRMDTVGNGAGGADDASLPHVDLWGINHYPGSTFGSFFDDYTAHSSKPLIVTEYGIDAWNYQSGAEYEAVQAQWGVSLWEEIEAGPAAGGSLMEYSDERWKDYGGSAWLHDLGGYATTSHPDQYANEEWWGVMRTVDNGSAPDIMQPRAIYDALQAEFVLRGDFDGNGAVNGLDIPDFKEALADPEAWSAAHPDAPPAHRLGDVDGNGAFNGLDIPGFKQILGGG